MSEDETSFFVRGRTLKRIKTRPEKNVLETERVNMFVTSFLIPRRKNKNLTEPSSRSAPSGRELYCRFIRCNKSSGSPKILENNFLSRTVL